MYVFIVPVMLLPWTSQGHLIHIVLYSVIEEG
jgi:hypothetical protein